MISIMQYSCTYTVFFEDLIAKFKTLYAVTSDFFVLFLLKHKDNKVF